MRHIPNPLMLWGSRSPERRWMWTQQPCNGSARRQYAKRSVPAQTAKCTLRHLKTTTERSPLKYWTWPRACFKDCFDQPGYSVYRNSEEVLVLAANGKMYTSLFEGVCEFCGEDLDKALLLVLPLPKPRAIFYR